MKRILLFLLPGAGLLFSGCLVLLGVLRPHSPRVWPWDGLYSATCVIKITDPYSNYEDDPPELKADGQLVSQWEVIERHILADLNSPELLAPVIADLHLDRVWSRRLNKGAALTEQEAMDRLKHRLKIERYRGSSVFQITATSENPREAADIANAIAKRYRASRDDMKKKQDMAAEKTISDKIAAQSATVNQLRADAAKAPQGADPWPRVADAQKILDSLQIIRKQQLFDDEEYRSPVRISSPAVPSD